MHFTKQAINGNSYWLRMLAARNAQPSSVYSRQKSRGKIISKRAEMNEKVAQLQQTKLFTPKNIHQIAEKMNLPVKKSETLTPLSKNPHLSSSVLINQIFDDSINKGE